MSSKRGADRQITKDDREEEEGESEPVGTWKKADESVLAKRVIRKAKRPTPSAASAGDAGVSSNPFASVAHHEREVVVDLAQVT